MLARRLFPLTILLCVLAAPAARAADTGGTEYTGDAFVAAPPHALLGGEVSFTGSAPPNHGVVIERLDRRRGWVAEATATGDASGRFTASWRPAVAGLFQVRAVPQGQSATVATAQQEIPVTIYRPSMATWYGPGFFGRRTACGQRLTRRLLGVAHKKLPCGTQVALYYEGRSLVVPVVDRGPFRRGMRWDLTHATAEELGFTHTDRIGAVRLR
jgi:hypothetical protein